MLLIFGFIILLVLLMVLFFRRLTSFLEKGHLKTMCQIEDRYNRGKHINTLFNVKSIKTYEQELQAKLDILKDQATLLQEISNYEEERSAER